MKVTLVYNLKEKSREEDRPIDYYSEFDSIETIEAIGGAIRSLGYEVGFAEADRQIVEKLLEQEPDIVLNIAEGYNGKSRESQIPALLDYLGIPYTGSGVLALALSLDKGMAKGLFLRHGIPTPKFQIFKDTAIMLDKSLRFPLIVKPNNEGSGKGITKNSVVYDNVGLYREVDRIIKTYCQEALVEEFIDGKELTVGVLGNNEFLNLPVLEIDFSACGKSGEYFYSWRMKEYQGDEKLGLTPQFYCPARLDEDTTRKVKEIGYKVHRVLGCKDISRIDIRLGKDSLPYVLEANPLPGLDPRESNFPIMTKAASMDYNIFIGTILQLAISRYGLKEKEYVRQRPPPYNTTMTYINTLKKSPIS